MRRVAVRLCLLFLIAGCSEPPQKEIDRAQGAVDTARAAGAEQYAPAEFAEATTALQQAHDAVTQRDYRLALTRALDASQRAQESARLAADGQARARSDAEVAVHGMETALQQLETKLKVATTARTPEPELKSARQALFCWRCEDRKEVCFPKPAKAGCRSLAHWETSGSAGGLPEFDGI